LKENKEKRKPHTNKLDIYTLVHTTVWGAFLRRTCASTRLWLRRTVNWIKKLAYKTVLTVIGFFVFHYRQVLYVVFLRWIRLLS